MKKILVSNIYGPYNLGDYAIRQSAMKMIREVFVDAELFLLCESPNIKSFKSFENNHTHLSYAPYGYAIRSKSNKPVSFLIKSLRLMRIVFMTFYSMIMNYNFDHEFYKYVRWIKESDRVILMGGGYFITKNSYRDFFGLILNLLPIFVAKYYKKPITVLPISYGPIASPFHNLLTSLAFSNIQIYCRDKISLSLVKNYNSKSKFSPDLALYEWENYEKIQRGDCYVLTVKDYLERRSQRVVEDEITTLVDYLWENYKLKCIFIPTGANPIEENDIPVGERIRKMIKSEKSFNIVIPEDPRQTKRILKSAKFAICTRMHSAILSACVFTPFIALSYEHKVTGLLKVLNLEKWGIDFKNTSFNNIHNKYLEIIKPKNYNTYLDVLRKDREEILKYRDLIKGELTI